MHWNRLVVLAIVCANRFLAGCLFYPIPFPQETKVERILGYTVEQMSYKKALEVLGISEAMMEEERAKVLGSLGVPAWGNPAISTGVVDQNCSGIGCCGKRHRGALDETAARAAPMCEGTPLPATEVLSKLGLNTSSGLNGYTFILGMKPVHAAGESACRSGSGYIEVA